MSKGTCLNRPLRFVRIILTQSSNTLQMYEHAYFVAVDVTSGECERGLQSANSIISVCLLSSA